MLFVGVHCLQKTLNIANKSMKKTLTQPIKNINSNLLFVKTPNEI
jgi:hypothetical protein